MPETLISIQSLSHRLPDGRLILNDINLDIPGGTFVVLCGKNGSGKTMLMRHLNGLAQPVSGQVLLEGRPVLDDLQWARQMVGLVFQQSEAQIVAQTVESDTAFGPENLRLKPPEVQQRVDWALQITGLESMRERNPYTLSGGEQRRLALAGVIAMRPKVLVLDEPFTALDQDSSHALISVLSELHNTGSTIILITHNLAKVLAHADRLIIMREGQIHADGLPGQVIDHVTEAGVYRPPGPVSGMSWKEDRGSK